MVNFSKNQSISDRCAPAISSAQQINQRPRIWTLTQLSAGILGDDHRIISCAIETRIDGQGNYQGEQPYAVLGEIQKHTEVAPLLRSIEGRPAIRDNLETGLVYRKLPRANGIRNAWLTSAEAAMNSLVNTWGRVTSDHNAGEYRFERLNFPGRQPPEFPDVDALIDELFADFVIDRLDHPVLEQLLAPNIARAPEQLVDTHRGGEEGIDEIY